MRLSRDSSGWKAGSVKRRDFRHEHGEPEVPRHRTKRKNGKRFCRGKPGRQHIPVRVPGRWYDHDACVLCGKHLTYYWKRSDQ